MTGRCRCGHETLCHDQWRPGTDCGICGPESCPSYRPERPWDRWRVFWRWTRPPRRDVPPAETIVIRPRPRPLPLPMPEDDEATRTRLRVPPWLDEEKPRAAPRRPKHASAPWEQ